MRAVLQRVATASVSVDGEVVGAIGPGIVMLVGVGHDDGMAEVEALAAKVASLRIFHDENEKMNRSIAEAGGAVLVVSQFTLLADVRKGRRPSFTRAAAPAHAEPMIEELVNQLRELDLPVETGEFGAMMQVEVVNDGPVTIVIDVVDGTVR
jgi:D-tyrosyl-tRNA(Tyr) deacylase